MASRLALLTGTLLAAAVLALADTPKPEPSPRPSPSPKAPRAASAKDKPTKATSPSPGPSKAPDHVFTNEDLPAQPSPAAIASPGPAGTGRGTVTVLPKTAAPEVVTTPIPEEPVAPEANPALWQERARTAREVIRNAEKIVADLEQRIAELRDDRSPTNLMDPNREQHRQAQIAQAQADLEAARANLDRVRQALVDLEEEARRKGIPPGWLRER